MQTRPRRTGENRTVIVIILIIIIIIIIIIMMIISLMSFVKTT